MTTLKVELTGRVGPDFTLDIAFQVPSTGVTALLGPSGSGKTSVLRALAGFDRYGGNVSIAGVAWQNRTVFIPTHRRRIGYVPQGFGLLPHYTVSANLDYAMCRAGNGRFDRADIIARTGIVALLDRLPAKLSGGEMQRVSLARALVSQPRLLLLDEPLSGLNPSARVDLLEHFNLLFTDLDIPVVYVTHDIAEATRLTDVQVHLNNGRVIV